MALATETNAVQMVLEILDASTASDYENANGKPGRIERSSETTPAQKRDYEKGDACYLYAVGEANKLPLDGSGDAYEELPRVAIDIWTLDGEGIAEAIAEDIEAIVNEYWTENSDATLWTTIRVVSENDYTHETFRENPGQHDRHLVTVEMRRKIDL